MEDARYILYADDDCEDQETFKDVVAEIDSGLKVVTVSGGQELLKYLSRVKKKHSFPCLVVLDINMPKMDGIETLRELKSNKTFKKLPVVMFSTSDNPISVQTADQLGAADYVQKPVTYDRFLKVARQFIDICKTVPDY